MPTISASRFGYTGSGIAGEMGPVPFRSAVDAGGSSGAVQKMVPLSSENMAGRACAAHMIGPATGSCRKARTFRSVRRFPPRVLPWLRCRYPRRGIEVAQHKNTERDTSRVTIKI